MSIQIITADVIELNPTAPPPEGEFIATECHAPPCSITKLDVFFMIDATGSMSPAIEYVRRQLMAVITVLTERLKIDVGYGLGIYRDFPHCFTTLLQVTPFNADTRTQIEQAILAINASGGGDTPECQIFAFNAAASNASIPAWRPGSKRVIAWAGDAPGHDPSGGVTTEQAIANLKLAHISVSGISVGGDGLNARVEGDGA